MEKGSGESWGARGSRGGGGGVEEELVKVYKWVVQCEGRLMSCLSALSVSLGPIQGWGTSTRLLDQE